MIKLKVKANTYILMAHIILANEKKINKKEKAMKFGLMELNMMVIINKVKSMVKEYYILLMEAFMMENLLKIIFKV